MRQAVVVVVGVSLIAACGSPGPTGGMGGGAAGGSSATGGGAGGGGGVTLLADGGAPPTYWKDVKAITQKHCEMCHVAGGIGPFQLQTYAQAQAMSASMKEATAARRMPPWKPDPNCGGPFRDERKLTDDEIRTIGEWAAHGTPEGNPSDAPPPADALAGLPRVDATLAMPEAYTPNATLSDDYRCFVIDPGLTAMKQVVGYDIQPGTRTEVHHVILYVADKAKALAADVAEAGAGWTCFGGAGVSNDGAMGAWAPGMPAVTFPQGTGINFGAGKVVVMQVHYNTAMGVSPDTTSVKLQYATGAVTPAYMLPLVADTFSIPPMAQGYSFTKDFPNRYGIPIKVYGLLPHMHTKGTHINITGPSNTCLVDIPQWDFHWQQSYFRPAAFMLNAGEKLTLSCTWNNPTSSTITWGEGTADEMCFAYIYATP